jgi:hypothetical protein
MLSSTTGRSGPFRGEGLHPRAGELAVDATAVRPGVTRLAGSWALSQLLEFDPEQVILDTDPCSRVVPAVRVCFCFCFAVILACARKVAGHELAVEP